MKARFSEKLATGELADRSWRFMTLTVRSSADLGQQLHDLRSAWYRMRHQRWLKGLVSGGLYCVDITETPAGWHAHIHAILTGEFVPVRKLRQEWQKLTGAYIVGVQPVTNTKAALSYMLRELKKVPKVRHEQACRDGMRGLRLIEGFGDYYKAAQGMAPAHMKRSCPCCGSIETICLEYCHPDEVTLRFADLG